MLTLTHRRGATAMSLSTIETTRRLKITAPALTPRRSALREPALGRPTFGRAAEIAAVCSLLLDPEIRLVTITGPGGVGKTRLATSVGAQVKTEFEDGVVFVPLAKICDPDMVLVGIARSLGLSDRDRRTLLDRVAEALRETDTLLILDNFEHVIGAAALVSELLTACPCLNLLVTSREILRISGEQELPLNPMPLPPPDAAVEDLAANEAVQLFVDRAIAATPGFQMTPENARAIAAICAKLDGLPLAIELGAARMRHLTPQTLLTRLSTRLPVLTHGAPNLPLRQQTMRDAIAWSYELLTTDEQLTFRRLSVFAGSFSLSAAEAVAGIAPNSAAAVLDGIVSLVEKSLLVANSDEDDDVPRWSALEMIREYGLEQLMLSGEAPAIRRAHAEWCLAFTEQASPAILGPERMTWLGRFDVELPNLRLALWWAGISNERAFAMRMVSLLTPFWESTGSFREGSERAKFALAMEGTTDELLRAAALRSAGQFAYRQGRYDEAVAYVDESLQISIALGNRRIAGEARTLLGNVAYDQGELELSVARYDEALRDFEAADYEPGAVDVLSKLGLVLSGIRRIDEAERALQCALVRGRTINSPHLVSNALGRLAFVEQHRGNLMAAMARIEEALPTQRELDPIAAAAQLWMSASIARDAGDLARSAAEFGESMAMRWRWGERRAFAESLESLGEVASLAGRWMDSARIAGGIAALRRDIGVPGYRWEEDRRAKAQARAKRELGETAYRAVYTDGETMPVSTLARFGDSVVVAIQASWGQEIRSEAPPCDPHGLTIREVDVLQHLAGGRSDREIASELFISPRTVARHLHSIYSKLDVNSRLAAIAFAHRECIG